MADLRENLANWQRWDWSQQGDEWSAWWGGTDALWYAGILPRVHSFVPAATILEIAPGHGRWTQYLKDLAERLVIVDLTESCIDYCRERFAAATNIEYHVNDGRSLEMVEDGSIDFVFSFDSLVHAEADVLAAYVDQLSRKLAPGGAAFIHHSNIGGYRRLLAIARRVPPRVFPRLARRGLVIDLWAWRAESVTAEGFARMCEESGLACVSQELISWEHGPYLIDALSVVAPSGSERDRGRTVIRNRGFRREAARTARLYSGRQRELSLGAASSRADGR